MLHITLVTFRDDLDHEAERDALTKLAQACLNVNVLKPHGAEAKRSWHVCIETRGAIEETHASAAWAAVMASVVEHAEVYKAWTFEPS